MIIMGQSDALRAPAEFAFEDTPTTGLQQVTIRMAGHEGIPALIGQRVVDGGETGQRGHNGRMIAQAGWANNLRPPGCRVSVRVRRPRLGEKAANQATPFLWLIETHPQPLTLMAQQHVAGIAATGYLLGGGDDDLASMISRDLRCGQVDGVAPRMVSESHGSCRSPFGIPDIGAHEEETAGVRSGRPRWLSLIHI